jgi:mono/diheme cytochrome c family protein
MKLLVILPILAVFAFLLYRKANLLTWALAWWIGFFVAIRWGFSVPIPSSVVFLYMGSRRSRCRLRHLEARRAAGDRGPDRRSDRQRQARLSLAGRASLLPALAATASGSGMSQPIEAPFFARTVHTGLAGRDHLQGQADQPRQRRQPVPRAREVEPREFKKHVEAGRKVYYENCHFCHGDNLESTGMFVHGLDPIPTNFNDQGTIPMLRETFLFWRIARGGPGFRTRAVRGLPRCRVGEVPHRRADLGRDPLPVRLHGTAAASQGRERKEMTRALLAAASILVGTVGLAAAPDLGSDADRKAGATIYAKYCSQCHGDTGGGDGYAAVHLKPRPRNFTTGKFKIRTTGSGVLPTTADLKHIIHAGMPYTSMPAWPKFTDDELKQLAYFIKSFSADFANPDFNQDPIKFEKAPKYSKESAEAGRKVYEATGCIKCHGDLGRGDGPSARTLVDDWGFPIKPADFTQRWTFRGGPTREDIFRTMTTGLNGTPMPAFGDALKPEDRWAITDYMYSLGGDDEPHYANLITAKHVDDPIDLTKGAAAFEKAPAARIPIVGQIMEPGREFHPPVVSVLVQAIYDATDIAFLVRWNDMSSRRRGRTVPRSACRSKRKRRQETAAAAEGSDRRVGRSGAGLPAEAAQPRPPYSDAVAIQLPLAMPTGRASRTSCSATRRTASTCGSPTSRAPAPTSTPPREARRSPSLDAADVVRPRTYDKGEWSVIFKAPACGAAASRSRPGLRPDRLFGLGRGSHERGNKRGLSLWTASTSSLRSSSRPRARRSRPAFWSSVSKFL